VPWTHRDAPTKPLFSGWLLSWNLVSQQEPKPSNLTTMNQAQASPPPLSLYATRKKERKNYTQGRACIKEGSLQQGHSAPTPKLSMPQSHQLGWSCSRQVAGGHLGEGLVNRHTPLTPATAPPPHPHWQTEHRLGLRRTAHLKPALVSLSTGMTLRGTVHTTQRNKPQPYPPVHTSNPTDPGRHHNHAWSLIHTHYTGSSLLDAHPVYIVVSEA